ncbi:hypothetical protein BJ742DRAFT_779669 [Cladochytrium replicatum]|nr:hypothetical protein BJ742DRAFT_779669 [Cladochytrium replicatum]
MSSESETDEAMSKPIGLGMVSRVMRMVGIEKLWRTCAAFSEIVDDVVEKWESEKIVIILDAYKYGQHASFPSRMRPRSEAMDLTSASLPEIARSERHTIPAVRRFFERLLLCA